MSWYAVDTNISILYEFIGLIILFKLFYIVQDIIWTLSAGNWYKKISSNIITKHIYNYKVSYNEALNFDKAPNDIISKRTVALQNLKKSLQKYKYKQEVKSTDSKLNPKAKIYCPGIFHKLVEGFYVPHMMVSHEGCILKDENDNTLYDLSNGNAANIIGNIKGQEIVKKTLSNDYLIPACGFSSIATRKAIDSILQIYGTYNDKYDSVSFYESGSAAVKACIAQARFYYYQYGQTTRRRIVVFKNAYHGWIIHPYLRDDDVDIVVLDALDINAFKYIISNYLKIAAIFVDPMKVLSCNKIYPRESLTIGKRVSDFSPQLVDQYARWMRKLNEICKKYDILYVLDECYSSFRIGPYSATIEYKLRPDILIISKQLGCQLNTCAIVGNKDVLIRKKNTSQVIFTVGTGSTNPMHHMVVHNFVQYALTDEYKNIHKQKMKLFENWTNQLNKAFTENKIPLKLHNYYNCFSLDCLSNSYYNWIYVLKLISNGCLFTPGGTTKFTLSFDYNEEILEELTNIFIKCGREMIEEGWFYEPSQNSLKKEVIKQVVWHNVKHYTWLFFDIIRYDKEVDVGCSHNHPVNKWTHFWSSVLQLGISYPMFYYGYKFEAMLTFLIFHVLRQTGHFFYEAQLLHDERIKIGYKNATKKRFAYLTPLAIIFFAVLAYWYPEFLSFKKMFILGGLSAVINRWVDITETYGLCRACSWFVKIITDVVSDIYDFQGYWNPLDKKINFDVNWDKINENQKAKYYNLEY